MTVVTRRMLLVPYIEALESEFLLLNCSEKNRAFMNGPLTVSLARQAFQRLLYEVDTQAMAVLNNVTREYMGHIGLDMVDDEVARLTILFDHSHWNHGYASEAITAFLPHICQQKRIKTVLMNVPVLHTVGLQLMKKLGFMQKAQIADGFLGDYYQFEWQFVARLQGANDEAVYRPVVNENRS
ncbi:GNAT family N-acetyltransferase [Vibrio zhugei]|uniref:GNAT family N-acetyltransferase n=1 Tax=Vibrio zhugei TaxID=2479546 RepID=A0ABV7C8B1_9VIBR|nr:GNAT family N-acetyltransferase [Vibrio zhugei]